MSSRFALALVVVMEPRFPRSALLSGLPVCGVPALGHVLEAVLGAGTAEILVLATDPGQELERYLHQHFGARARVISTSKPGTREQLELVASRHKADDVCLRVDADFALISVDTLARMAVVEGASQALLLSSPGGTPEEVSGVEGSAKSSALCFAVTIAGLLAIVRRGGLAALERGEFNVFEQGGLAVREIAPNHGAELSRVCNTVQLAAAEDFLHARIADQHRRAGAIVRSGVRIDSTVSIAAGATIEQGVVLRGKTRVGTGARIDVGCVLTDVDVAPRVYLKPYSVGTSASIGEGTEVGPFSHLRPDTRLGQNVRIGNFVETKNVTLGDAAMANHLAFLGDGEIGARANIGAGTIFCNSDGVNKFRTEVGEGAFVGSGCELVAPVKVGAGAFVATGTTVTEDVAADALAIGRARQQNKPGYAKRLRARFAELAAKLTPGR